MEQIFHQYYKDILILFWIFEGSAFAVIYSSETGLYRFIPVIISSNLPHFVFTIL